MPKRKTRSRTTVSSRVQKSPEPIATPALEMRLPKSQLTRGRLLTNSESGFAEQAKEEFLCKREDMRTCYRAAREEVLARVGFRERWLLGFLGAVAATMVAILHSGKHEPALVVPILALIASATTSQHTAVIHTLCCWTRTHTEFDHWGLSQEMRDMHDLALPTRAAVQTFTFTVPSVVSLLYSWQTPTIQPIILMSGLWWGGWLCTLVAGLLQFRAWQYLRRRNREAGYNNGKPS